MRARERRRLEATAYHEAGHAAVSLALRLAVRSASIIPDHSAGTLGHIQGYGARERKGEDWECNPSPRLAARIESHMIVPYAGPLAEAKHTGRRAFVAARQDRETILNLAPFPAGPVLTAYLRYIHARAKELVEREWRAIEAIATALLERGMLSGRSIRELRLDARVGPGTAQALAELLRAPPPSG
jgi:hypothetical protein